MIYVYALVSYIDNIYTNHFAKSAHLDVRWLWVCNF